MSMRTPTPLCRPAAMMPLPDVDLRLLLANGEATLTVYSLSASCDAVVCRYGDFNVPKATTAALGAEGLIVPALNQTGCGYQYVGRGVA